MPAARRVLPHTNGVDRELGDGGNGRLSTYARGSGVLRRALHANRIYFGEESSAHVWHSQSHVVVLADADTLLLAAETLGRTLARPATAA